MKNLNVSQFVVDSRCKTIAVEIAKTNAWSRFPELADALERAGMSPNHAMIRTLRRTPRTPKCLYVLACCIRSMTERERDVAFADLTDEQRTTIYLRYEVKTTSLG